MEAIIDTSTNELYVLIRAETSYGSLVFCELTTIEELALQKNEVTIGMQEVECSGYPGPLGDLTSIWPIYGIPGGIKYTPPLPTNKKESS